MFEQIKKKISRQNLFLDSWGKDSEVWKKTSPSQIQLIPLIAALVLSLVINFYPDLFMVSWWKSLWFIHVFYKEKGASFTQTKPNLAEKTWKHLPLNFEPIASAIVSKIHYCSNLCIVSDRWGEHHMNRPPLQGCIVRQTLLNLSLLLQTYCNNSVYRDLLPRSSPFQISAPLQICFYK